MNIKKIREMISKEKYNDIPLLVSQTNMNIKDLDYLNSIISGISKITKWNLDISFEDFISQIKENSSSLKWNETTYTSFIALYSNILFHNYDLCIKYLHIMKLNNIIIKKRTISPVFNLTHFLKDKEKQKEIYLISKINNINIDFINYLQLIDLFKNDYIVIDILKDLISNKDIINTNELEILKKIFGYKELVNPDFSIFDTFKLCPKIKTSLLLEIENFIKLSLKNKIEIKKFLKYLNTINKNDLIILDGANIGFFQQGKNSGIKLNFVQIFDLIKKLKSLGKNNILLFLNINHFSNLDSNEKGIVKEINKISQIYKTPKGVNDDYFWLYTNIYVDNSIVVSNDEICDHIYYLDNLPKDFKKYKFSKYNISSKNKTFNILLPPRYLEKIYFNNNNLIIPYSDNKELKYLQIDKITNINHH